MYYTAVSVASDLAGEPDTIGFHLVLKLFYCYRGLVYYCNLNALNTPIHAPPVLHEHLPILDGTTERDSEHFIITMANLRPSRIFS
jgi:hypothetical protein